MLLYLDLNCFNRPFDDQSQARIAEETAAVFSILQRIVDGVDQMAWSAVLTLESSQHPLVDRRTEIAQWAQRAVINLGISNPIAARAKELANMGIGALDAAHLACAEAAGSDYLLTCDDRLIKRAGRLKLPVKVQSPTEYLQEFSNAPDLDG